MAEIDAGMHTSDREMIISRLVDAPRERVFDAFTDREHIGQWWGPNGFATTTDAMDVSAGGVWRFTMHGADGTEYRNVIGYTRVERPAVLRYEHGDDAGPQFSVEVGFALQGLATMVTLHMFCRTAQQLEEMKKYGAEEGGQQTLERLDRYLAGYGSEM
jgi:uncharacterized protein YndB with AHSA1/START domain